VIQGGLQRAGRVGRGQAQGALLGPALGAGIGQRGRRTAGEQVHAALMGQPQCIAHAAAVEPGLGHHDRRAAGRGMGQQAGEQVGGAGRQQQQRRLGRPLLGQRAQQVLAVDALVVGMHEELHAGERAGLVPERAIAEGETAENRLRHGRGKDAAVSRGS